MQIITGKHKGRKLFYPKKAGLRPTTSRVKEALFNILGSLEREAFLDLFAGGGSIGLEALSRGAIPVVFVEKDFSHCQLIEKNLSLLGEKAKIYGTSFEQAIKAMEAEKQIFSYVYLDPEYQSNAAISCLQVLDQSIIINKISLVIAEHSVRDNLPLAFNRLVCSRQAKYGDTGLTFYKIG